MIIAINAKGELELREPNDFKGFKVLVEQQGADVAAALKGVATLDDEHAWVSQAALKNWKGQPQSPEWIASFDKMADAVKKFGWVRESDGAIRAHIEKAG